MPGDGSEPQIPIGGGAGGRPRALARWRPRSRFGRFVAPNEPRDGTTKTESPIALSAALVALVMIFALAAVATATIICQYELADEAARPARQRVEINATASPPGDAPPQQAIGPSPMTPSAGHG